MNRDISNTEDILDSRDIFARIEELEAEKESMLEGVPASEYGNPDNEKWIAWEDSDEYNELKNLSDFMEEWKGNGGDEQWRGDWYPVTIIRDSYWVEYVEELLQDIGDLPKEIPHYIVIDWERTADNIQQDYTSAEFDGVTYWAR